MSKTPEEKQAYKRAWYLKNQKRILEELKAKRDADPEKTRADGRRWGANHYALNTERERARSRRDYTLHKTKQLAYQKTYLEAHPRDPVLTSKRNKEWTIANPDKRQAINKARYARKRGATVCDFTAKQWREMKEAYGHRCVYCGEHFQRLSQDHIIPLIKGGSHTASNIVPACQSCNSHKHAGPPLPFAIEPLPTTFLPEQENDQLSMF